MSSGKLCCKSWRKLLVPGMCPTLLLEVNYCFSCTAKTTCASIPAVPAHSPAPSSAPASSSKPWAVLCPCPSVPQQTWWSNGWGWLCTCSPGNSAYGCRSSPLPLMEFSDVWSSSNKQRGNSLTRCKGYHTTLQSKIIHFTPYASKPALFMWLVGWVFLSLWSRCDTKEEGQNEDLAEVFSGPR